jgi:pilus assembly protein FimV
MVLFWAFVCSSILMHRQPRHFAVPLGLWVFFNSIQLKERRLGKSAVRALIVFMLCALLPLASWAAGLGRLSVLSSLGQPLRAEIEVVSQPGEDLDGLSAKLAPIEAYRVAKIEFADALLAVTASVQRRGNALVVLLSSIQPMNDPFIDVLVELNWASGRLVREYTFLLDPPEYRGPAQAAMPRTETIVSARQAPSMIRSPWAKLISPMIP